MKNGAELLIDALVRHGVDTVFGFPGDTSIAIYDVLHRRGHEIRHVLARDERHAGFMADAYSRTTRRLGVCEAPSGAGAVYLASGMAEAFAASVPMLAITTDNNRRSAGTAPISEIDQLALFSACTKWRRCAERADDIPALVEEAIVAATSGRPGPVVLILPEDVVEDVATVRVTPSDVTSDLPGHRTAAPEEAVTAAARKLARAARPVVVAGGGAHLSGAGGELIALAEHLGMPIGTSVHGKGVVDEAHPLALGVVGGNGARPYANQYVADADLVLFVGTRANATDTLGFTAPRRGEAEVLHVEADEHRAGRNYPGSSALVGDAAIVLAQLRARLPVKVTTAAAELAAAREAWLAALAPASTPDEVLDPREVVRTLRDVFGPDTWVVADAGTPTPYLSCFWEAPGNGWQVTIPRGHGPLGFAVPASIGVAVGHPGARVMCVTTENSVAMAAAEWETAKRLGLPITYVVLDNTSLAWIKMIQHLYNGGRYFAVDPGPIDSVRLAEAMGVPGSRARTLDELAATAKESASLDGPSVIHVAVPEHMDAVPPVPVWQAALSGETKHRPIH